MEVAALLEEARRAGPTEPGDTEQCDRADEQPERHRGLPAELGAFEGAPRHQESGHEQHADQESQAPVVTDRAESRHDEGSQEARDLAGPGAVAVVTDVT